ncbi:MAG: aspartate kinase, partial [Anaerolineae bacterium]|nr:aspartate kinase [Anaerolineae bacterium]
MLVIKFGGTSVRDAACMAHVAGLIEASRGRYGRLVVVVSAM